MNPYANPNVKSQGSATPSWNIGWYPGAPVDPELAKSDPRGLMAQITRGQWQDFKSNAVPVIQSLQGLTTYDGNAGVVDQLKADARTNAANAFSGMVADTNRQAQGFGMSISPASRGALERSAKLGTAAATVDGVNRASTFQRDLNRQIVAGSNLSALNS